MSSSVETLSQGATLAPPRTPPRERRPPRARFGGSRRVVVPSSPTRSRSPLSCASSLTPPTPSRGPSRLPPRSRTTRVSGLQRRVAPAVRACDRNVASLTSSQADLTAHIDRVAHELELLLENLPEPAAEAHAEKIRAVRDRISKLGGRFEAVMARAEALREKAGAMRRANLARLADDDTDELPPEADYYVRAPVAGESGERRARTTAEKEPREARRGRNRANEERRDDDDEPPPRTERRRERIRQARRSRFTSVDYFSYPPEGRAQHSCVVGTRAQLCRVSPS